MVTQKSRVFIVMQLAHIVLSIIWNIAGIILISRGLRSLEPGIARRNSADVGRGDRRNRRHAE